jgi:predicted transcriptional regulator
MSTRVVTAHIPEELALKLDRHAESLERSRGWIVKQALADWIDWEERKLQMTLEALEEADREGTISHEDMLAWADSLGTDTPLPPPMPRKR